MSVRLSITDKLTRTDDFLGWQINYEGVYLFTVKYIFMSPAIQIDKLMSNHVIILLKEIKRYENRSLKKKKTEKTHYTITVNLNQSDQSRLKLFCHHLL